LKSPARDSGSFSDTDATIGEPISDIFAALFDDPGEAARLNLLSDMMDAVQDRIRAQGWTQKEAAKRLGVTQPRISDLMRGKISLFSIDALVVMLNKAGVRLEVTYRTAA